MEERGNQPEGRLCLLDVLLLVKKRAPTPPPTMADVSAEEKVSFEGRDGKALLESPALRPMRKTRSGHGLFPDPAGPTVNSQGASCRG